VSVPMTLSELERWNARVKFFRRISLITLVPLDLERPKFGRITHVEGIFLGDSHAHITRSRPQRSPILGVSFYLCIHRLTQNYQI